MVVRLPSHSHRKGGAGGALLELLDEVGGHVSLVEPLELSGVLGAPEAVELQVAAHQVLSGLICSPQTPPHFHHSRNKDVYSLNHEKCVVIATE